MSEHSDYRLSGAQVVEMARQMIILMRVADMGSGWKAINELDKWLAGVQVTGEPKPNEAAALLSEIRAQLEHIVRCCAGRYDGTGSTDGYRVVGRLWLGNVLAMLDEAGISPGPQKHLTINGVDVSRDPTPLTEVGWAPNRYRYVDLINNGGLRPEMVKRLADVWCAAEEEWVAVDGRFSDVGVTEHCVRRLLAALIEPREVNPC